MYSINIIGSNGKELKFAMVENISAAQHFTNCVFIFIDCLHGGKQLGDLFRLMGKENANDTKLTPLMAVVMFVTELHNHPAFDPQIVLAADNINHECYRQLYQILEKPVTDTSTYQETVNIITKFQVEGIKKIIITRSETATEQKLTDINFPMEDIPENYLSPITSTVMHQPCTAKDRPSQVFDLSEWQLNKECDPYIRIPISLSDIVIDTDLAQKIELLVNKVECLYHQYRKSYTSSYQLYKSQIYNEEISFSKFQEIVFKDIDLLGTYRVVITDNLLQDFAMALRRAASLGNYENLAYLLNTKEIDPNIPDDIPEKKKTALHWAVIRGIAAKTADDISKYENTIITLLRAGADTSIEDASGKTPKDYDDQTQKFSNCWKSRVPRP